MAKAEKLYYIQNKGQVGNCLLWWRVEGHGYTCNLNEAWQVNQEKAAAICRSRPREDIPWPVKRVDKAAERHVSLELLIPWEKRKPKKKARNI